MPLALLLVLSLVRMSVFVMLPGMTLIQSEVIYPAVVNFFMLELVPSTLFGFGINLFHALLFIWVFVSLVLIGKHVIRFYDTYKLIMAFTYDRDTEAEKVLHEVIGARKSTRVYRTFVDVPFVVGIKPYIFIPENIEFSQDELRIVLRHEWSHIQGNDVYIRMMLDIICAVFWWNPLSYALRKNIIFTQELRSDFFAIDERTTDFHHYMSSIIRLNTVEGDDGSPSPFAKSSSASMTGADGGLEDRVSVLFMRMMDESPKKRILPYMAFYIGICVLFVFSYTILLLPAHWETPYGASAEYFIGIEHDQGEVFSATETFLVDNNDGTFSLYIDGIHIWDQYKEDILDDVFNFFIVIER